MCIKRGKDSVCIITFYFNPSRAVGYRCVHPWHGLGRPMGTGYICFVHPKHKRIIKCQKRFMWMVFIRKKPGLLL